MGYGNWLHGEAVATGMVMAAELSSQLGMMDEREVERTRTLVEAAQLPSLAPEKMNGESFVELMAVDKKVIDGRLRLVLMEGIGKAVVSDGVDPQAIASAVDDHHRLRSA